MRSHAPAFRRRLRPCRFPRSLCSRGSAARRSGPRRRPGLRRLLPVPMPGVVGSARCAPPPAHHPLASLEGGPPGRPAWKLLSFRLSHERVRPRRPPHARIRPIRPFPARSPKKRPPRIACAWRSPGGQGHPSSHFSPQADPPVRFEHRWRKPLLKVSPPPPPTSARMDNPPGFPLPPSASVLGEPLPFRGRPTIHAVVPSSMGDKKENRPIQAQAVLTLRRVRYSARSSRIIRPCSCVLICF